MRNDFSRREALALACAGVGIGALKDMTAPESAGAATSAKAEPFRYCFNTSTIRGQKKPIVEVIDIVAKAGYHAIEPWIDEIERYKQNHDPIRLWKARLISEGILTEEKHDEIDAAAQRGCGQCATKRDRWRAGPSTRVPTCPSRHSVR